MNNKKIRTTKTTNEERMESVGGGVGPFKVWATGKEPLILFGGAALIVSIGYGLCCLIDYLGNRGKTKTDMRKRTHYTNEKIRETEETCRAEAEKYRAKAETDVWKAEAMKKLRTDEHQPNEEQQKDQEGSEDAFEIDEPLPSVGQEETPCLDFANNRLFDKIIHRGEIGMFFGPKGNGKSIVSYWIALNVAEGKHITVWNDVESTPIPPTKVLYYDLELSRMDIQGRYDKYGYVFPENFIRHDNTQIKSSQDIIRDLFANVAQASGGEELFAVVDNIKKAMEITCAQTVKPFMKDLEKVINTAKAKGVTLTILLVNHPTKDFKLGDSLELGDAAGSTELYTYLNFAFVIEPTKISKQHKILKELSLRGETEPENVAIVKLENEAPYVQPVVLCEMDEKKALNIDKKQFEAFLEGAIVNPASSDKRKVNKTGLTHEDELEIYRLHKEERYSPEQLAKMFGPKCKNGTVSDTTIRNIIARIEKERQEQLGT